ncbi:MAG: RNA 2',3'-cyclic phosphodiesterase [Deltaproteobacteria bacterium]|nr:MAG: RNA 2',3'-cyclic phosphodiesterase [Deltaproteobacteria bacterium]
MGIRLFLAFELPPEIRQQIGEVSTELQKLTLPVRWVKVTNIHLTIIFLGYVNEDTIDDIKERVNPVVKRFSEFKTRLNGIGVFPNWRRPRVIWIGLNGEIERLSNLREELQTELKVFGFKPEKRPFTPHLTIGRFKGPVDRDEELKLILDRYHDLTGDLQYLRELVLFKSDLRPDGPVYTKMASWPLRTEN